MRSTATILPASWLRIRRRLESGTTATSEKSASPASAGLKRLTEFSVAGEPLVAVPAGKSTPVWKIPSGSAYLTTT
jgi:hypothetical protein